MRLSARGQGRARDVARRNAKFERMLATGRLEGERLDRIHPAAKAAHARPAAHRGAAASRPVLVRDWLASYPVQLENAILIAAAALRSGDAEYCAARARSHGSQDPLERRRGGSGRENGALIAAAPAPSPQPARAVPKKPMSAFFQGSVRQPSRRASGK